MLLLRSGESCCDRGTAHTNQSVFRADFVSKQSSYGHIFRDRNLHNPHFKSNLLNGSRGVINTEVTYCFQRIIPERVP